MPFRPFQIACLAAALVLEIASAHAVSPTSALSVFNPPVTAPAVPSGLGIPQLEAHALTNAQRLAAGLPLKAPHRRASRTSAAARRATPSDAPTIKNVQGYIQARDLTTGSPQGYLSAIYNNFGQAGLTTDLSKALVISLDPTASGPISIHTINGPYGSFPFLGAINGFASTSSFFGTSSFNYAYLGATLETEIGAAAMTVANAFSTIVGQAAAVESGVWHFDAVSNAITLQWINPDLFAPTTYVAYTQTSDALFITGDVDAFDKQFGVTSITLELTFIPL